MLIAGRVIAGLAVGVLLSIVPVYNAELALPQYRGVIVGLFAVMASFGVLTSNWIGYGCQFATGDAQWRIPLGCQIPTAVLLCIGATFLPESPRWCKCRSLFLSQWIILGVNYSNRAHIL
jgi:MFS family permease